MELKSAEALLFKPSGLLKEGWETFVLRQEIKRISRENNEPPDSVKIHIRLNTKNDTAEIDLDRGGFGVTISIPLSLEPFGVEFFVDRYLLPALKILWADDE